MSYHYSWVFAKRQVVKTEVICILSESPSTLNDKNKKSPLSYTEKKNPEVGINFSEFEFKA